MVPLVSYVDSPSPERVGEDRGAFFVSQIGGGPRTPATRPRRHSSPPPSTPTRLRTVLRPTPTDDGVISAALIRRAKLVPDGDMIESQKNSHPALPDTSKTSTCVSTEKTRRSGSSGSPAGRLGLSTGPPLIPSPAAALSTSSLQTKPTLPPAARSIPSSSIYTQNAYLQLPQLYFESMDASHNILQNPIHVRDGSGAYHGQYGPWMPQYGPRATVQDSHHTSEHPTTLAPYIGSSIPQIRQPTPVTHVIPPTPTPIKQNNYVFKNGDDANGDPLQSPAESQAAISTTPTRRSESPHNTSLPPDETRASTGRISTSNHLILQDMFEKMDDIINEGAHRTCLSSTQIISLWNKHRSAAQTTGNMWNAYQTYFKMPENQATELERLYPSATFSASEITAEMRTKCFAAFKEDLPDSWMEILEISQEALLYDTHEPTVAQRARTFNKFTSKVIEIGKSNCAKNGFEMAVVFTGKVVNQDASLGRVSVSDGAKDFFQVRCRADDDAIIGHMKAHVFDLASKAQITDAFANDAGTDPDCPDEQALPTANVAKKENREASSGLPTVNHVEYVKDRITAHVEALGGRWPKPKNFPWATMGSILASCGIVCENYPIGVAFPGDKRTTAAKSKGISDLTKHELALLVHALDDHDYPLQFKLVKKDQKADLVNSKRPVILGVPPPAGDSEPRGRRKFANGLTDKSGLPRLKDSFAKTTVKASTKRASGHHESVVSLSSDQDSDDDIGTSSPPKPLATRSAATRGTQRSRKRVEVVIPVLSRKRKLSEDEEGETEKPADEEGERPRAPRKRKNTRPTTTRRRKYKSMSVIQSSDEEVEKNNEGHKRMKRAEPVKVVGGVRKIKKKVGYLSTSTNGTLSPNTKSAKARENTASELFPEVPNAPQGSLTREPLASLQKVTPEPPVRLPGADPASLKLPKCQLDATSSMELPAPPLTHVAIEPPMLTQQGHHTLQHDTWLHPRHQGSSGYPLATQGEYGSTARQRSVSVMAEGEGRDGEPLRYARHEPLRTGYQLSTPEEGYGFVPNYLPSRQQTHSYGFQAHPQYTALTNQLLPHESTFQRHHHNSLIRSQDVHNGFQQPLGTLGQDGQAIRGHGYGHARDDFYRPSTSEYRDMIVAAPQNDFQGSYRGPSDSRQHHIEARDTLDGHGYLGGEVRRGGSYRGQCSPSTKLHSGMPQMDLGYDDTSTSQSLPPGSHGNTNIVPPRRSPALPQMGHAPCASPAPPPVPSGPTMEGNGSEVA